MLLASQSIFSRECARETADSMTLVRSSHAAMVDYKSRCDTAVTASIETVDAVDTLLIEVRSMFPGSLYPAMLSVRNILVSLDRESRGYAGSLRCLIREIDEIEDTASADVLQSITAIQTLVASESSIVARLLQLTTEVSGIVSQHIAFLNEHMATLRITDQRFDSDSAPVRTGLHFYEKRIAGARHALRDILDLLSRV